MDFIAYFFEMMYYIDMNTKKAIYADLGTDYYANTAEGAEGISSSLHFHNLYEIYLLEYGKREYLINGNLYPVEEDCIVLVPPGIFHETTGKAYKRRLFHFSKDFLLRYYSKDYTESLLEAFSTCVVRIFETDRQKLFALAVEAEAYFTLRQPEPYALCLGAMLSLIKSANVRETPKKEVRLIDRVSEYIENNACRLNALEDIAEAFFISKYYLCRLFMAEKHMTVFDFLMKIKIEKAAFLLATTKKKVKEISTECGFNSEYYFSKRFHTLTGLSPSHYRNQLAIQEKSDP